MKSQPYFRWPNAFYCTTQHNASLMQYLPIAAFLYKYLTLTIALLLNETFLQNISIWTNRNILVKSAYYGLKSFGTEIDRTMVTIKKTAHTEARNENLDRKI